MGIGDRGGGRDLRDRTPAQWWLAQIGERQLWECESWLWTAVGRVLPGSVPCVMATAGPPYPEPREPA